MKKILFSLCLLCAVSAHATEKTRWIGASMDFGDITDTYAAFFTSGVNVVWFDFLSTLDCRVCVSFDSGDTCIPIPANGTLQIPLGSSNMHEGRSPTIKYVGDACTSGSIQVTGAY